MADATHFYGAGRSFTLLTCPVPKERSVRLPKPATSQWPQKKCSIRESWSLIIPNASTQGPPTSSAVQVNLGNSFAVTKNSLGTELEARLLPAIRSSFDLRHPSCQLFPLKGRPLGRLSTGKKVFVPNSFLIGLSLCCPRPLCKVLLEPVFSSVVHRSTLTPQPGMPRRLVPPTGPAVAAFERRRKLPSVGGSCF
jgi:hypothetical protein